MVTLRRFCKRRRNFIVVAIFLYFMCLLFLVKWLGENRQESLFWQSDTHRTAEKPTFFKSRINTVNLVKNANTNKPNLSFEREADKYVANLLNNSVSFCGGNFMGYGKELAKLSNVVLNPTFGIGRKGGETINEVLNQKEDKEFYELKRGYFKMKCSDQIVYPFTQKSHLNNWVGVVELSDVLHETSTKISTWTIAVLRYEYANLYLTMTDYFNAFLVTRIFDIEPAETNILWVDGHPIGALDSTWGVLFCNVTRVGEIKAPVMYENLVWSTMGYHSMLNNHTLPSIPYLDEFRDFFLSRHNILLEKALHCEKLNVLFLWRRDYLAHPRNPSGHVSRKIKNEDELLQRTKELLPGHIIEGIQIDKLTMKDQLNVISKTDILIGMHGAGLTHVLFLPKYAGVIELYPTYWSSGNRHFRDIGHWRGIHYKTWINEDKTRELAGHYTIVDVDAVMKMLREIHHEMCGGNGDK